MPSHPSSTFSTSLRKLLSAVLVATLAACGGEHQSQQETASQQGPTISSTDGASLTFLSTDVDKSTATVRIARDGHGAPALPPGMAPAGAVYQFTPLGFSNGAVTLRIPFEASQIPQGTQPRLFVALPGEAWTEVTHATLDGNTATAVVPQLAYATVGYPLVRPEPSPTNALGIAGALSSALDLSVDPLTSPALPGADTHGLVRVDRATNLVLQARYQLPAECSTVPKLRIYGVQTTRHGTGDMDFKTIELVNKTLDQPSGIVRVEQSLSANNNGLWTFAAVAHCPSGQHTLSRYAYLSTGPVLKVSIQPGTDIPVLVQDPQNASVIEGSPVSFSVIANGSNLSYQWQRSSNGGTSYADMPGATSASVNLVARLTDDGTLWRVIVSSNAVSVTSAAARLSVTPPGPGTTTPVVTQDPANQSVVEGETASFSAAVSGHPAPVVQWQTRPLANTDPEAAWVNIPGATARTYTTGATALSMSGGQYRALFQNAVGSATTLAATLTVQPGVRAPSIITNPASQAVQAGQFGLFSVNAGGSAPLSYQWFKNGQPIVGANASEVLVQALAQDVGSSHQITVQVSNAAGTVTSMAAAMTVILAPGGTGTLVNAAQGGVVTLNGSTSEDAPSLSIPPGALAANTTMRLTSEASSVVGLPADVTPLGDVLSIGPNDLAFIKPATLSLPVPGNIPNGKVLALIELPGEQAAPNTANASTYPSAGTSNLRRLTWGATRQGAVVMAAAATPNIQCADTNSFSDGKLTALVSKAHRVVPAAVSSSQCAGNYIPAPPRGNIPSDTDQTCSKDEEFVTLRGDNEDQDRTLVSRHVDCRTAVADTFDKKVYAALIENPADGTFRYATAQEVDERKQTEQLVGSFKQAEVQTSIFGKSDGLTKTLRVRVRIKDFQPDLFYRGPNQARDSVTVRPEIACRTVSTSEMNRCSFSVPQVVVPLGGSTWSNWVDIPIAFNWTAPTDPRQYDVETFRIEVSSIAYVANGNADRNPGQAGMNNSYVEVRCDRNVTEQNSRGCILPRAAPVYVLRSTDLAVSEAAEHVRDAQATLSSPGRFLLKPNTRAVADESVRSPTAALQRLKNGDSLSPSGNPNRQIACGANSSSLIRTRPQYSQSCTPLTEGGAVPAGCQCDEYPFSSTYQGAAYLPTTASARYINGKQNSNAGSGYLSKWYLRQRLLDLGSGRESGLPTSGDSDYFWVHVPNAD